MQSGSADDGGGPAVAGKGKGRGSGRGSGRVGKWALIGLVVAGVLAALLAVGIHELDRTFEPGHHVAVGDPRACRATGDDNETLAQAMGHFRLALPTQASGVAFNAVLNSLDGGTDLQVRFRTTAAGLAEFLRRAGLPPLSSRLNAQQAAGLFAVTACGLAPPSGGALLRAQDTPATAPNGGGSTRTVAVDRADPSAPLVWVAATDT